MKITVYIVLDNSKHWNNAGSIYDGVHITRASAETYIKCFGKRAEGMFEIIEETLSLDNALLDMIKELS